MMAAAASDLERPSSTINAATAAASAPTTRVVAGGADEVSAAVTALFDAHAKAWNPASNSSSTQGNS
jgi:hypothetical protein